MIERILFVVCNGCGLRAEIPRGPLHTYFKIKDGMGWAISQDGEKHLCHRCCIRDVTTGSVTDGV